jgi:lysine decarboxylase
MSLINLLKKKTRITLFTTPSHSQRFFIFDKLRQFYKYDISEVDAYNPEAALKQAEENAAKIYKTRQTKFLINGSTSGVECAVLSCVNKNDKVLIWRNAHRCHKNAVKLAGAEPVFYDVDNISEWGVPDAVSSEVIEGALKNNVGIKAVIITSPTYEGVVSDIKTMSRICHNFGAYLIVDEAHGALYPFCEELPISAIYSGADFVVQSLHKTAGGLNPTALIHSNCDIDVTEALKLISTTSPSYPLLASIEKNINYLNSKKGRLKISQLIKNIRNLKLEIKNVEFFESTRNVTHDETKILIKHKDYTGYELSEMLFEKFGIEDEITNQTSTMLLCGLGTDIKKMQRLSKTLKKL